jgi:nucleotide-binding universal stress UspA family protein
VKLDSILFPTDFSETSEGAGRFARDLAREGGGTLHIVHVVPPVTSPADSATRLAEAGRPQGDGVRVQTALLSGLVAREIVRYARDHGVGLIVMSTHGRTGLSHAILGSVAEAVVRLAPCPVLTVPARLATGEEQADVTCVLPARRRCVVCATEGDYELVCEACRVHVRAEALEHKRSEERSGRRGSPI